MAELAVGLSKSVVVGAITKVQSAIDEDTKLRQKAQRDLVFISLELEMMQSFVDDAANKEEMKNNLVRTWVKHIRQLAYDVEDCVENVVHLDDDKPVFWRRLLPSFMAPVLPLDLAVKELEQLKGRVVDVNECYRRYSHINDTSVSKLAAVMQQQQQGQPPLPPGASNLLAEARGATKRQHGAMVDLTQLITKSFGDTNDELQVISVWGAGGGDHGTTTPIIRKTYNHPLICQNFAYRAWVKLTHPFSPQDLIRTMMAQFYANSPYSQQQTPTIGMQVLTKMDAAQEDLFKDFEKVVTQEMYLVVFQGLTNMVDWDTIRTFLPDAKKSSWIIVSTQQPEIATLCLGRSYQISELKTFSHDHSICALYQSQASKEHGGNSNKTKGSQGDGDEGNRKNNTGPLVRRMKELGKYPAKARANSPAVMSVCGIAGVGKTALVRNLFDIMCQSYQFDNYYWVDVSHPFNIKDLYMILVPDFQSEKDPIEVCHNLLKNNRCLVVIDDLQSTREWDLMQASLVSKHSKSVIIVITSDASIATYCTNNEDLIFNVKALTTAEAIDLFKNLVSTTRLKLQDEKVQELILKCGGISKVIAAVAGWLYRKDNIMDNIRLLNRRFMHYLETDPEFGGLQGVFGWLNSMVLNPPAFLKPCIFYLSIFPQGQIIRRRRLVRRWIAEGYSTETMEMQAEENGEMFFSELLELSIFQQVQLADTSALNDVRMALYQVNGFIRDYIVSRKMEENLVFELGDKCAVPSSQSRCRHLIILERWHRDGMVFEKIDFSRLRSLTVFGKWETFLATKSMQLVRVLDLENAYGVTDDDVKNMVKMLQRLKFLSLRGCHEVHHLPSSLGDLRQLQTLDVRHTSIVALPENITKLQKLQYIRAGTSAKAESTGPASCLPKLCGCRHRVNVVVPGGIAKLTGLHTLGVISVVASRGNAMVKAIKRLAQLRKLGLSGIDIRNSKDLFSAISGHRFLESLSVQLLRDNESCLDDIGLPENLQSLKLFGLRDRLPQSIHKLSKLIKMNLEMAALVESDIEFLARLPELRILRIAVKQPRIRFYSELCGIEENSYEKIKILQISCSSSSLHVTFGSKAFRNLELLKLDCSTGSSSYRLSGLNFLYQLKHVLLLGTDDETLKTDLQTQFANHPKSPVVKLDQHTRSI